MTTVIFSMCGAEIVTVAAAESAESGKTMSRLAASVVVRILLFYVLVDFPHRCASLPWNAVQVRRFHVRHGARAHRHSRAQRRIMDCIVLTAVLSCLNSGVYVTARVMFAMADKGDAPRWLTAVEFPPGSGARDPVRQRVRLHLHVSATSAPTNEAVAKLFHAAHQRVRRDHAHRLLLRGVGALPLSIHGGRGEKFRFEANGRYHGRRLAALRRRDVRLMALSSHGMAERLYPSLGLLAAHPALRWPSSALVEAALTRVEKVDGLPELFWHSGIHARTPGRVTPNEESCVAPAALIASRKIRAACRDD